MSEFTDVVKLHQVDPYAIPIGWHSADNRELPRVRKYTFVEAKREENDIYTAT